MTVIYFSKLILALGWKVDWRGRRIDAKILVLPNRVSAGLNWGWGSDYGCEAK